MSRKRKRARNHDQNPAKRQKAAEISHPVLRCYYAKTITLRTYILCQLPDAAREARKRIRCLDESDKYKDIAQWIDSVIIGCGTTSSISHEAIKAQELALFTQQRTESTLATSSAIPSQDFPEIVNRVIWLLFGRETNRYWPSHLLCQGYRRAGGPVTANQPIPGLVHSNPSHRVETMKGKFWCDLCRILGPAGERIMEELLLNCGIFVPVECGRGSYYQLNPSLRATSL
ncbi:hypothetical protein P152DRAFT_201927 [Eremomyces bilateralis CBS 781.70]|uniref:Uncharacterized protein n=1 Tax=Eremomyces bilateralis CBS 781.70 TaxID=1392243 RepID=A0A6G1GCV3_9PEZI|nr:uncharacterized protein P152DRAFT_201927 [Eremomyces bilateralis CBS 781.70]KAF1815917.1 hypothetical protein P152DRAFT_201927 [Eremomyces bilateralis CBS 781.70]